MSTPLNTSSSGSGSNGKNSKTEKEALNNKKEEKKINWQDPNEQIKYVCDGAKVQCSYCNPPIATFTATAETVMLQDKAWGTVGDKDGKNNFGFTGVCMHPSQQKPMTPPPPCKSIISLGDWENFSETIIGNHNALLVKSTIPCMISGSNLTVTESGQKATLTKINPLKEEAHIVSIDILDDADTPLSGEVIQYVNLKKEKRFIDGKLVKATHQLGKIIRCKVKFDKPKKSHFTLKLEPASTNLSYTTLEKKRNTNFKFQETELNLVTDEKGEKIVEGNTNLFLDQAGGNKYKITATDNNGTTLTSSANIKTLRLLYYVVVKMKGLNSVASSLSIFENEFKTNHILFNKYADASIAYMENIGVNDASKFQTNVTNAYNAHAGRAPYCIAIAYTDHLAVKDASVTLAPPVKTIQVGPGAVPILFSVINAKGKSSALWNNIVKNEDWFVDCIYTDSITGRTTSISKTQCTPFSSKGPTNYYNQVKVDVSNLPLGNGHIELKVNSVNRMRGGLSFTGTNIVAICTRAWWRTISTADQNQVMIHEVGHKVGMVPNGNKLDKPVNYYDSNQGHVGSHCHTGIPIQKRYDDSVSAKRSMCVMYGATNGKTAFCTDCAKCVKKTDVSNGANY